MSGNPSEIPESVRQRYDIDDADGGDGSSGGPSGGTAGGGDRGDNLSGLVPDDDSDLTDRSSSPAGGGGDAGDTGGDRGDNLSGLVPDDDSDLTDRSSSPAGGGGGDPAPGEGPVTEGGGPSTGERIDISRRGGDAGDTGGGQRPDPSTGDRGIGSPIQPHPDYRSERRPIDGTDVVTSSPYDIDERNRRLDQGVEQLDDQTDWNVTRSDVRLTDEGNVRFSDEVLRERAAQQFEEQTDADVGPGDVTVDDGQAELSNAFYAEQFEEGLEAQTGVDLVPGEDYTVQETSDGQIEPVLTGSGRSKVSQERFGDVAIETPSTGAEAQAQAEELATVEERYGEGSVPAFLELQTATDVDLDPDDVQRTSEGMGLRPDATAAEMETRVVQQEGLDPRDVDVRGGQSPSGPDEIGDDVSQEVVVSRDAQLEAAAEQAEASGDVDGDIDPERDLEFGRGGDVQFTEAYFEGRLTEDLDIAAEAGEDEDFTIDRSGEETNISLTDEGRQDAITSEVLSRGYVEQTREDARAPILGWNIGGDTERIDVDRADQLEFDDEGTLVGAESLGTTDREIQAAQERMRDIPIAGEVLDFDAPVIGGDLTDIAFGSRAVVDPAADAIRQGGELAYGGGRLPYTGRDIPGLVDAADVVGDIADVGVQGVAAGARVSAAGSPLARGATPTDPSGALDRPATEEVAEAREAAEASFQDLNLPPELEVEEPSPAEWIAETGTRGIGSAVPLAASTPELAVSGAPELTGEAATFTAQRIDEEGLVEGGAAAGGAAVDVGVDVAEQTAVQAINRPVETAGMLVGTAGIMGGARAISPRAGLASRAAIQPGEELLGYGGYGLTRRVAGTGAANRLFPNQEPLIFSEEAAIRGAQRIGGGVRGAGSGAVRLARGDVDFSPDVEIPASPRQQRLIERGRPGTATETAGEAGAPGAVSEPLGGAGSATRSVDTPRVDALEIDEETAGQQFPVRTETQRDVTVTQRAGAGLVPPSVETETRQETEPAPDLMEEAQETSFEDVRQDALTQQQDFLRGQAEMEREAQRSQFSDFGAEAQTERSREMLEEAQQPEVRVEETEFSGGRLFETNLDTSADRLALAQQPIQSTAETLGGRQDLRPDMDIGQEPRQSTDVEQDTEALSDFDTDLDMDVEADTESEFETELEQEFEFEMEWEQEPERETELEPFDSESGEEDPWWLEESASDEVFQTGIASAEELLDAPDAGENDASSFDADFGIDEDDLPDFEPGF